ncbi:MAG TPA: A/G-specific adenine glycosylase [Candidatus Paceibacterota bacterium]|nr:A/G-specific adenine glycosylase [Verrucomicrobiota bacterium]HOX01855.1 A/G-specific adenine glycosylase [Verrucomicrobiota bacterium]HRZ44807.1 A/G-specific adenine glycosylase [Candidatus Paceibacterota bacterium]HRZ91970.1 A/G-specific adenine glycosylase [Candidatus Paceibacterota bacterium]
MRATRKPDPVESRIVAGGVSHLRRWYARHARDLPWRRTRDPYAIWVSEIMLQQTRVATVIPYWERWMKTWPTVRRLAEASLDDVLKLWEGLGYYRRARRLHQAARIIADQYGGHCPRQHADWLALPGIGPYIAGAIASIAFNLPAPVLDGNVARVLCRWFDIGQNPMRGPARKRLWSLASLLVQEAASQGRRHRRSCGDFNQALMELGAVICTPKNPQCARCPIDRACRAHERGRGHLLPRMPARQRLQTRRIACFILQYRGRFLVERAPARSWNAGLWGFPQIDIPGQTASPAALARRALGFHPGCGFELSRTIRHSITRFDLRLAVYAGRSTRRPPPPRPNQRWATRAQIDRLALSAAHRKIARAL